MARFVVTRAPGPAWDRTKRTREQADWEPHARFMDGLADERFVAFGGPAGTENEVVLIVDAADVASIRARLELDPWDRSGLLVTVSVQPWTIWLGADERLETIGSFPLYLVAYGPGPDWQDSKPRREQADWTAHAKFIDSLVDQGVVILGGPLDERRALLVMQQADEALLRAQLADDPWYDRILIIEHIAGWALWLPPRPHASGVAT
jgi:uncharacterized protein YciI